MIVFTDVVVSRRFRHATWAIDVETAGQEIYEFLLRKEADIVFKSLFDWSHLMTYWTLEENSRNPRADDSSFLDDEDEEEEEDDDARDEDVIIDNADDDNRSNDR